MGGVSPLVQPASAAVAARAARMSLNDAFIIFNYNQTNVRIILEYRLVEWLKLKKNLRKSGRHYLFLPLSKISIQRSAADSGTDGEQQLAVWGSCVEPGLLQRLDGRSFLVPVTFS